MFRLCFIVCAGFLLLFSRSSIYAQNFEKTSILSIDQPIHASSFIDLNNDFYPDLAVFSSEESPSLFLNKEGKAFYHSPLLISQSKRFRELTWIDYNNDGILDLFTLNKEGEASIYDSPQSPYGSEYPFILTQDIKSLKSSQWLDINQDGWLDLYVAPYKGAEGYFFEYTPHKGFQKLAIPLSLSIEESYHDVFSWVDFDENGTEDLFVSSKHQGKLFIKNEGYQAWRQIGPKSSYSTSKISLAHHWIDFDNDEDLDLFIVNKASKPELFENNGYGKFRHISKEMPTPFALSANAHWIDIDNDGDLDVITQSPLTCDKEKFQLLCYYNDGNGTFSSSSLKLCGLGQEKISNFLCADYDLDGRQDLLVFTDSENNESNTGPIHLYRNCSSIQNNWLLLKCLGSTSNFPLSNSQAIGVKVYLKTIQDGQAKTQMRTIKPQITTDLQGDMLLHFGLGSADRIESLRVEWPSGRIDYLADLAPNHVYVWRENEGIERVDSR